MKLSITDNDMKMEQGVNVTCVMHLSADNQLSFTLDLNTEDTKMFLNFMRTDGIPNAERVSISVTTADFVTTVEASPTHG